MKFWNKETIGCRTFRQTCNQFQKLLTCYNGLLQKTWNQDLSPPIAPSKALSKALTLSSLKIFLLLRLSFKLSIKMFFKLCLKFSLTQAILSTLSILSPFKLPPKPYLNLNHSLSQALFKAISTGNFESTFGLLLSS